MTGGVVPGKIRGARPWLTKYYRCCCTFFDLPQGPAAPFLWSETDAIPRDSGRDAYFASPPDDHLGKHSAAGGDGDCRIDCLPIRHLSKSARRADAGVRDRVRRNAGPGDASLPRTARAVLALSSAATP